MQTIGLVLSGGGARGIAHLGVLTALEEMGVRPAAISGVSAGAIVGALYAGGMTPSGILAALKSLYDFKLTDLSWLTNRLFALPGLRKMLERQLAYTDIADLPLPLYITTTNILTGQAETYARGNLVDLVIASSSIPVMADPVVYGDGKLLDGGILNNLPVEPLLGKYGFLIGSYVNKLSDGITPTPYSRVSLIDQCFHLAIAESVARRAAQCHVYIEPLLSGFGMFDVREADRLFDAGYRETMACKPRLQELLLT